MVKFDLRSISVAAVIALLSCAPLAARELTDYHVGDKLDADIIAPQRMTVVNVEATEALKEKEGQSVPVICRFYPGVATEVEAALRAAFTNAHESFLQSAEVVFGKRTLDDVATASPEFRRLVNAFLSRNTGFPLTADIGARWARGQSDGGLEESLAARLRGAMQRPIRPYGMPEGLKLTYTVRLVPLPNLETQASLETVEREGRNVNRTNLITLPWARSKLRDTFAEGEQLWGRFVSGFVKENCYPDPQLTRQARAQKTDALQIADTYEAGQTIARIGDPVDGRVMAAIGKLIEQTAATQLHQNLAANETQTAVTRERNRWLIVALAIVSVIALLAIWLMRRTPPSMLPANIGYGEGNVPPPGMRARVAPHLARLMMDKLFQGLISQRKQLIATQEKAADEVAELEAQLEKVRAPLEERLHTYEQRIADLEKELAVRGEENQELLKAKIFMVKKQMAATRAKGRLELN